MEVVYYILSICELISVDVVLIVVSFEIVSFDFVL